MNKTYLLKKTRKISLVYMAVLIIISIYILLKLLGLYFSSEIITFKNLVYSDLDSSFFTKIISSFNPSLNYYQKNNESDLDIKSYNQIEALYGYNIPLVSFVMRKSDYSYVTSYENYPKINSKGQIVETEDDERYEHDESVFASHTIKKEKKAVAPINYTMEQLKDFPFLLSHFYIVDKSVPRDKLVSSKFPVNKFLSADMSIDTKGKGPKILIYHTHSQESFVDSVKGETDDTVVGVGDKLTKILEEKYNLEVLHHRGVYDVINGIEDRDKAYQLIEAPLKKIIKENPSIEVLIDLHRDGVNDNVRLVKEINGKNTAKIMFFNGLAIYDHIMPNKYVTDNMAFSFQMHLKANELYPGITRKIYLRPYRFNMHLKPKTLLIELGAQTNTVEEAKNAMEPLAKILYEVIK